MNRLEKNKVIEQLTERFSNANFFYIADSTGLTVADVNSLRRLCHQRGISMRVAKNTLIRKALEAGKEDYKELFAVLNGQSALFFCEVSNLPAKVFQEFRKGGTKPVLKAAYIDRDIYIGDDQLDTLARLKSKNELIGDVILLLQSPAKNVIGALQASRGKLAGILKTLSEKEKH